MTRGAAAFGGAHAPATAALIALNIIVFLAEIAPGPGGLNPGGRLVIDYGLFGPAVAEGDWCRLLTCGFLHANVFPHLFFNMLLLFLLGRLLEPAIGTPASSPSTSHRCSRALTGAGTGQPPTNVLSAVVYLDKSFDCNST